MRRDDRGAVTAMVTVLAVVLLALGALIFDGARVFAARRDGHNLALQAARAGAQQLDEVAARTQVWQLDPADAESAVRDYLAAEGVVPVAVRVDADRVEVQVRFEQATPLWSVFGIDTTTIDATAVAVATRGVTGEDP